MWSMPDSWSFEEGASVPVAYSTAYYALVVRGRLRRGEAVLIHSGSGGVGQAAIAIALSYGCTVYTTVGSEKVIDLLPLQSHGILASNTNGESKFVKK